MCKWHFDQCPVYRVIADMADTFWLYFFIPNSIWPPWVTNSWFMPCYGQNISTTPISYKCWYPCLHFGWSCVMIGCKIRSEPASQQEEVSVTEYHWQNPWKGCSSKFWKRKDHINSNLIPCKYKPFDQLSY